VCSSDLPFLQIVGGVRYDAFEISADNLLNSTSAARTDRKWSPRAGVIVERDVLALIQGAGIPVSGPLRDYLYANFAPAYAAGSHEFWVRKNRPVAPLGTAQYLQRAAHVTTGERARLEFILNAPTSTARVATV
jgi:hypothetical protein